MDGLWSFRIKLPDGYSCRCMDMSAALAASAAQVHATLKGATSEEETIKRLKRVSFFVGKSLVLGLLGSNDQET